MVLSVKYVSSSVWQEVCKKVKNAVVFLDEAAGECLSWHGGLDLMWASGAAGVKEFSSFECGEDFTKAVFLVSTPLTGPTRVVLRDLISNSKFEHCILITSCSPSVLTHATADSVSALHKLETDMIHWMRDKDSTAEIFNFLISCAPISDTFFTFPQFSNVFPFSTEDLQGKTPYSTVPRNLDLEALPLELQVGVIHMTTTLSSLLSKLSAKESIYCVGMLSSLVGSQLQKHSTSALRMKSAEHSMSLILIDRNLDVCGPLTVYSGNQSTMFDRMKALLPPFPDHSIDVAVDMSPLCFGTSDEVDGFTPIAPGSLHEPPSDLIDTLINRPSSEIVFYLYTKIAAALSIESAPSKISTNDLRDLVMMAFEKKYDRIRENLGLVQAAIGVLNTFDSPKVASLEIIESIQKMLLQSIAAENGTNEAMQYLMQVVLERRDRCLSVDSVFIILAFFYSLVGNQFTIDPLLEKGLKESILEMLTEEVIKPDPTSRLVLRAQEVQVEEFCDSVFFKLDTLKNTRGQLEKYRGIARLMNPATPLEYDGILSQILCDVVDVTKPEIPDLKFKANISHRNNFTSRFTMILSSTKEHVMDNDVIFVFVIGGITGNEVKYINNILRLYGKQVIIGSTTLLSPCQVLDNIFIHDPLRPFVL